MKTEPDGKGDRGSSAEVPARAKALGSSRRLCQRQSLCSGVQRVLGFFLKRCLKAKGPWEARVRDGT